MASRNFFSLLAKKWQEKKFLCVGLDSSYEKIPSFLKKDSLSLTILKFNQKIIEATADLVCAYKINSAFYEAYGAEGIKALIETFSYLYNFYPHIPVILDIKRADIKETNEKYAEFAFKIVKADAVTLIPYFGQESLSPFLKEKEKGIFIICRSSNLGALEIQDLIVNHQILGKVPFYQVVAFRVAKNWNDNKNCGLVVGATYYKEAAIVRKIANNLPFLIPGVGKQGGEIGKIIKAAKDKNNQGIIINSSRAIIFASENKDFEKAAREKAKEIDKEIKKYL